MKIKFEDYFILCDVLSYKQSLSNSRELKAIPIYYTEYVFSYFFNLLI